MSRYLPYVYLIAGVALAAAAVQYEGAGWKRGALFVSAGLAAFLFSFQRALVKRRPPDGN